MERNIDLSILKKLPELQTQAVLAVRPLAPLSMVDELPGSFYKTLIPQHFDLTLFISS